MHNIHAYQQRTYRLLYSIPHITNPPTLITNNSVRIVSIPAASDILSVECQYRPRASSPSARWFDAPSTALDDTLQTSYLVTVPSLLPSSQYEVRIRYVNHLGAGPYSNPSEPFETFSDEDEALTPLAPLIAEDAAGATYADVTLRASPDKLLDPRNSRFLGKQNIRLFYRERSEDNFHRVNDPVTFEPVRTTHTSIHPLHEYLRTTDSRALPLTYLTGI